MFVGLFTCMNSLVGI
uniref:Uncharacterized protein n=1 Tax=Anguilla anguilla TaxID=7936 RepID=A0A0E9PI90_ANGAN